MFTGRRFDIEIGLYYNRARYYDPFMGRFLQMDPTGYSDGMNVYLYCMNNPLNLVDPSGKTSLLVEELAIYGGYWANQLPKLSYPGHWTSWVDFFGWYAHGEGETIDLAAVGFLDDLRRNEKLQDWQSKLYDEYDTKAKNLAKSLIESGGIYAIETYEDELELDFGGLLPEVISKVIKGLIDPSNSDPLVVLGNCTIKAEITITAVINPLHRSVAYWGRIITFSLDDAFADPGDIMDKYPGELEWMDCTPYKIIANFAGVNGGIVVGTPPKDE